MSAGRKPLFDDVQRTDTRPAGHRESTFAFLNRVAGEFWDHPRSLMEEWLGRTETLGDHADLRARLRCGDDEQFCSAFLELYVHEGLTRAGFEVTIHPDVKGTTSRPDFLAVRDGEHLYVEAIAPGMSHAAKKSALRTSQFLDTIDVLGDPNFILSLDELVPGPTPAAGARLRDALRGWLATLNPNDPRRVESAPRYTWEHDGWSATFRVFPIKPEARGRRADRRAIGIYGHAKVQWVDDAPAIRAALTSKHHEYGDLKAPFLIVVGTYIHDSDRWHTTGAMYGASAVQIAEGPDGEVTTHEFRQPDGYYGAPPHWQNPHVSGVLVVNQLMPSTALRAELTLWPHPAPTHPLPDSIGVPARTITVVDGALAELAPPSSAEFFGLPDVWPPGDPWPSLT